MKPPNPETDQDCRSLLQKAVRRGHADLAYSTAFYLHHSGDRSWLKRRTGVIVFEECWPAAASYLLSGSIGEIAGTLACVARCVKFKDAAGLGSLAFALHEGDLSVLDGNPDDTIISYITKALDDPKVFLNEAETRCTNEEQQALVTAASAAYRRGGWPWDRAFALAAAYLATQAPLPKVRGNLPADEPVFPYWVAIDRHTSHGKVALRQVARELNVPLNRLSWVSFYVESAKTNQTAQTRWWRRERRWRLHKVGLEYDEAFEIWDVARPKLITLLQDDADALQSRLEEFLATMRPPHDISSHQCHEAVQQTKLLDVLA